MKLIRYVIYMVLFTCAGKSLPAQDYLFNKVWMLGTECGIDFNSGVPVPIAGAMTTLEGVASATGPDGKLLFYTNGSTVWNSRNEVMTNGTDMAPFYSEQPGVPTFSCTQGAVIVPMPDSAKYYIFSLTHISSAAYPKLFYSVVDMKLNNCLGGVEPGRKAILLDNSALSEKMTAVRGNDCNIWIVLHHYDAPQFKSYEITSAGINPVPVISSSGYTPGPSEPGYSPGAYGAGTMKISPDRTRLALSGNMGNGITEIHRFNPATGRVSDGQVLENVPTYAVCFSPDNTRLYAAYDNMPNGEIVQFNLALPDITAIRNSKTSITAGGVYPGYSFRTDMQIGPDHKIYLGGFPRENFTKNSMYFIDKPNEPGKECKLTGVPFAWPNGTGPMFGYPNNFPVLAGHDTLYSSTVVKMNGCRLKEPIPVEIPDGRDVLWDGKSLCSPPEMTDTGVYVIKYLSPNCIYRVDTFIVPSVPRLTAAEVCASPNSFARLQLTPGDTTTWRYHWQHVSGQSIRTYTGRGGDHLENLAGGNYSVRLTNLNGCDTTLSFSIVPPPHIAFNSNGNDTACVGDSIPFVSVSSTEPIKSYHWNFDDNTSSTEKDPVHAYSRAGSYQVTHSAVSDSGCISNTLLTDVMVYPLPQVTAGPDLITIAGSAVILEGNTNAAMPGILWQPSVYLTDTQTLRPRAMPPLTQMYHLHITNAEGCSASDSMLVKVFPELIIPNAFTPNGDGIHDVWEIPALAAYPAAAIHVFNRWGQPVFESTGYVKPWDGTMNGKLLPMASYYYVIHLNTGLHKPLGGIITLLR